MSDRYTRIFSLDSALYAAGVPVLIAAGSLLKDSFSANRMAQLKYVNLGGEAVQAMTVCVTMLDGDGAVLSKPVEYRYQGLNAGRGEEFGRNVAVVLPDHAVCAFTVSVTQIVFAGGGTWRAGGNENWVPVRKKQSLEEGLEDPELAEQYRVRYGKDCRYYPRELGAGLWCCACGSVNFSSEAKCPLCRRSLSAMRSVNLDDLRAECAGRLKNEEVRAAEDRAASQQKNKKVLRAAAVILPALLVLALLLVTVPPRLASLRAYMAAADLLEAGEYEQAAEAFIALGSYRDSAEQAEKNVPYQRAKKIFDLAGEGDEASLSFIGKRPSDANEAEYGIHGSEALLYEAALEVFSGLGDYHDCPQYCFQCEEALEGFRQEKLREEYIKAEALLDAGNYLQAREAFLALKDYEDSATMAVEALYRKAVSLFSFTEQVKVRYLYAAFSAESSSPDVFYITEDRAMEIGSDAIGQLRAACGRDGVDVRIEEAPAGCLTMLDSLQEQFRSFGDYKDSAQYVEELELAKDFTRPFFQLTQAGDVYGAYDWLQAYQEEFADRDRWLELLEMYKPFCGSWSFNTGDPTLIPLTVGVNVSASNVRTGVIVSLESITLRIEAEDGSFSVELNAAPGDQMFKNDGDGQYLYFMNLSLADRFAYMKYSSGGMVGSCDYNRS